MGVGTGTRTSNGYSSIQMGSLARTITNNKYAHTKPSGYKESWPEIAARVAHFVVKPYLPRLEGRVRSLITERKLMPGGRYLYAAGRPYCAINNCMLFIAEDSARDDGGWADLMYDSTSSLMVGAGVGCVYSKLREEGQAVYGMGGKSSGPLALMQMVNEAGRFIRQGGSRRTAIWAGLHWWHPDCPKFVGMKNWSPLIHKCRADDFSFPAPMDGTNISVILDDEFFLAYDDPEHPRHTLAQTIYWSVVHGMVQSGEPGFSIDVGTHAGESGRNACTEVSTATNRDMCNLCSINLARVESLEEFAECVDLGIAFMLCGTLYGKLPVKKMEMVRTQNRRLGLGLMGVHDWLLKRGYAYGPNPELASWMEVYGASGEYANSLADLLSISHPVATQAIAPTGTISIVAETTSGIEPIFAAAYKRRYLDGETWRFQYKVDSAAKRLIDAGVDPSLVEDAFTLAEDIDRRVGFQAWMQQYVDMGISSTINLPSWGSSLNNESTVTKFGTQLFPHLHKLRGITAYPNGCRGGQPLNRVSYTEAIKHLGKEFTEGSESSLEAGETCAGGFCSS